ncbi:MAG TPA: hypothetical protein ENI56_00130, partial [Candidatus Kaiserbacteria bacterium]|nr:hypothetical protein [Candidatus Kaiserbacteria bacterium]
MTPTFFRNKFIFLGVLFVMLLSSGVLISRFGISGNSLSASAVAQPNVRVQHQVLATTDDPFSSAYLALGNTIIGATNASLRGYVIGIHMWVNTMSRIENVSTHAVLAVGISFEKVVGETAAAVPVIYLKGIYAIGNGMAYLSIKNVTVNSLASVELSKL